MPEKTLSDYTLALFINAKDSPKRPECIEAGIPEFVHIIVDMNLYKKTAVCFGIRLPNEKIKSEFLVLTTLTQNSVALMTDPRSFGDEIISLMTDNEPPVLTVFMAHSLTEAIDAAIGVLKGRVLQEEINNDYPLASI